MVSDSIWWYSMVFNGLRWSLTVDGIQWYWVDLEFFKSIKPIEHVEVLIRGNCVWDKNSERRPLSELRSNWLRLGMHCAKLFTRPFGAPLHPQNTTIYWELLLDLRPPHMGGGQITYLHFSLSVSFASKKQTMLELITGNYNPLCSFFPLVSRIEIKKC